MRFIGALLMIFFGFNSGVYALSVEPEFQPVDKVKAAALGGLLFNDPELSNPPGQSCATCHIKDFAFAENKAVSVGVKGRKGTRNAPSLMYNKYTPPFSYDGDRRFTWVGGQFWDGRADNLSEQALGPLLNPLEMNNTRTILAEKLRKLSYVSLFKDIYGERILVTDDALILAVSNALTAFQMTDLFAPFTSKFDYSERDILQLTEQEKFGRKVFQKYMCTDCHAGLVDNNEIFTNYTHNNILVPLNREITNSQLAPDSGVASNPKVSVDLREAAAGRFKTPTLRNIAITGPYMHNGVFKTLREAIEFYNDMENRKRWGVAPFSENQSGLLNTKLGMSESEIAALIAFLNTLTDGYDITKKR